MTKTIENIRFEIKHVRDPLAKKSDDWRQTSDQWLVTFWHDKGFFTSDYYTGAGHRKNNRAKTPDIKNVLYSLWSDSQAGNENFHDWCANYGYSDDSISALNTYKECLESARKLRLLGLSAKYLNGLFENY